jgi:hypothetical protein
LAVPHEIDIGGVYLPPILIAAILGALAALATGRALDRVRLSKYFFCPPLMMLSLAVIYTVIIGTIVVGI